MSRWGGIVFLLIGGLLVSGCARPLDGRTAVEHEREAERRRMDAEAARAAVRTSETTRPVPSGTESQADPTTPLAQMAAGRVARGIQTAEEHEEIARKIRVNAEVMCQRIRSEERTSCPIDRNIHRVEHVGRGVRLYALGGGAGGVGVETLRNQIQCALAQAAVDRPAGADLCPLLVPGVRTSVVDRPSGAYIEIIAPDEVRMEEVRRRADKLRKR